MAAQAENPAASVVIPHWNGRQHLDVCLTALRRQSFRDFETILVDNGSSDGSQAYLRQVYPEVCLLELGANRGFTGACNAGYAASRGKFVVLLNNDTEAEPNWLAAVLDTFARRPRAGSVASKIMLFDRRDHFHTAGDFYRADGIPGNRGVWQPDRGQFEREERVFSACGAAAAYRRAALEQTGFLDDSFYFSCEDVDLGWRLNLAGWETIYQPAAVVYHKLKATGGSLTGSYYDGRNFLYLIWKDYPGSLLRAHWQAVASAQANLARSALAAWRGAAARARLRGQLAGLAGAARLLGARRRVQAGRQASDESLAAILSPVDDSPGAR
ncbi:MAG: glycosyltransferase family 2 protein [Candidatus Promineifilaceae bacterium]